MAKYTTQIKTIVESGTPIFDFDYPIFDSLYRPVLEQKIINHYYFREIGLETVAQFKHFLKSKLTIIMPYYNEQYEALSVFKTYDPYINKDLTTTESREIYKIMKMKHPRMWKRSEVIRWMLTEQTKRFFRIPHKLN